MLEPIEIRNDLVERHYAMPLGKLGTLTIVPERFDGMHEGPFEDLQDDDREAVRTINRALQTEVQLWAQAPEGDPLWAPDPAALATVKERLRAARALRRAVDQALGELLLELLPQDNPSFGPEQMAHLKRDTRWQIAGFFAFPSASEARYVKPSAPVEDGEAEAASLAA